MIGEPPRGRIVEVATGLSFPEGPTLLPDGTLAVVELAERRVSRISIGSGSVTTIATLGGSPNGAALGPDGHLYVCNNGGLDFERRVDGWYPVHISSGYSGGSIQRVSLIDGGYSVAYDEFGGKPLLRPNDIVFDEHGGFYFTDKGLTRDHVRHLGAVYYGRADGSPLVCAMSDVDDPNGIGLSADGGTLYVATTAAGRVWAWRVAAPGQLVSACLPEERWLTAGARLVGRAPGTSLFDSLAVDARGRVIVATVGYPSGLTVLDPSNDDMGFVEIGTDPFVTNLCFVGSQVLVTLGCTGRVVALEWDCPGQDLH